MTLSSYFRMTEALARGILLLNKRLELLAFSSNQLRSASAWFMSPVFEEPSAGSSQQNQRLEVKLSADDVRYWIGMPLILILCQSCKSRIASQVTSPL